MDQWINKDQLQVGHPLALTHPTHSRSVVVNVVDCTYILCYQQQKAF